MKSKFLNRTIGAGLLGIVSIVSTSGVAIAQTSRQKPADPPQAEPVPIKADPPQAEPVPIKKSKKRTPPPAAAKSPRKPKLATNPDVEAGTIDRPEAQPRVTSTPERQPRAVEPQRQPRAVVNPEAQPRVVEPQRNPRADEPQRSPRASNRPARLPRERQQELIVQQRDRSTQYRQNLYDQERLARQRSQALRQERRNAQYRYQQQYYEALRRQRVAIDNSRNYNYNNDPYYYTAPSFRYSRGGSYYETNQYGADLLRQAVNSGYQQGHLAGRADRQDRWSNGGYEDSFAYQDANYGYTGRYVDQETYNHYFREGFQRGYQDGYDSRYEYGRRSGNGSNTALVVLASVLAGIVVFEALD